MLFRLFFSQTMRSNRRVHHRTAQSSAMMPYIYPIFRNKRLHIEWNFSEILQPMIQTNCQLRMMSLYPPCKDNGRPLECIWLCIFDIHLYKRWLQIDCFIYRYGSSYLDIIRLKNVVAFLVMYFFIIDTIWMST